MPDPKAEWQLLAEKQIEPFKDLPPKTIRNVWRFLIRDRDETYVEYMRSLLTPEQREALGDA